MKNIVGGGLSPKGCRESSVFVVQCEVIRQGLAQTSGAEVDPIRADSCGNDCGLVWPSPPHHAVTTTAFSRQLPVRWFMPWGGTVSTFSFIAASAQHLAGAWRTQALKGIVLHLWNHGSGGAGAG